MNEADKIACLLPQYEASDTALLEWLQPRVDDAMLMRIANRDSGMQYRENYEALRVIRDQLVTPARFDWVPGEVLELMRWCMPEWVPDTPEMKIHLARAFACAALLHVSDFADGSEIETLVQLIVSVLYLGRDASARALRFLLWRIQQMPLDDDDTVYFLLAILLLAVKLLERGQEETNLLGLVGLIEAKQGRLESERLTELTDCNYETKLYCTDICDKRYILRLQEAAYILLLDATASLTDATSAAIRTTVERLTADPR